MGFHIAINDDDGSGTKAHLGWSGLAHREYTYGHLTLLAPAIGGKPAITGIKVSGNNLELSITIPDSSAIHVVQQTSNIGMPQWADVDNVTFSLGTAGSIVATFSKPSSSPMFYRVGIR